MNIVFKLSTVFFHHLMRMYYNIVETTNKVKYMPNMEMPMCHFCMVPCLFIEHNTEQG